MKKAGVPSRPSLVHVPLHRISVDAPRQAALERREVEPDLCGEPPEVLRSGLRRLGEDHVMVLPELPLIPGAPRRL
jgi:hypothetical protein